MHELAIAQRLIDTAVALLPSDATEIAVLRVQLGALAGVSKDELLFGFEAMSAHTPCADATLEIEEIPAVVHCSQCGLDFSVVDTDGLICPTCGLAAVVVLQGKELLLMSVDARTHDVDEKDEAHEPHFEEASPIAHA